MSRLLLLIGCFLLTSQTLALSLTSTDFGNNDTIPQVHTCDAQDISPELSWSSSGPKIRSYALIVSDPDAPSGTWYHWVVYNIPKKTQRFKQGVTPSRLTGVFATNSFIYQKYNGPCPPVGKLHHYIFTVYALNRTLHLKPDATPTQVLSAIKGHVLEKAELTATYQRK